MDAIIGLVCTLLTILYLVLLVRIILSWVPSLPEPLLPVARFVRALTDPLLIPLRGIIPPLRTGGFALDLSPLALFFGIILLQALICR